MIYLSQNTGCTVSLTLNELTTLINPYYFIEFINCQSFESTIISLSTDYSTNKDRINIFNIDLPIHITPGYYDYNCYEGIGITFSTSYSIIETGKMLYSKPENNIYSYTPTDCNVIYIEGSTHSQYTD